MKQQSLSMTGYLDKGKKTRREQFLAEMERVVPWARLYALVESHYPKVSPKGGRPVLPLERMFRIQCLQQWYNLSDPGAEEGLYDSITMRRFAGVCSDDDVIPDETSILNFRRLLERHKLTERLLGEMNTHLCERGLLVGKGTIVEPSHADQVLAQSLKQALALVDVKTLDHFIVAGTKTLSFAERALI